MAEFSKALKKVIANTRNRKTTFEGLYLSANQLKELGKKLEEIPDGPNGVCFMIGKDKVVGKVVQTVEVIPYKLKLENDKLVPEFYEANDVIGYINVNVGKSDPTKARPYIISSITGTTFDEDRGSSQKTPPPHTN